MKRELRHGWWIKVGLPNARVRENRGWPVCSARMGFIKATLSPQAPTAKVMVEILMACGRGQNHHAPGGPEPFATVGTCPEMWSHSGEALGCLIWLLVSPNPFENSLYHRGNSLKCPPHSS